MKAKLIAVLITIFLSGCMATTEYVTPKIPIPNPPDYPTVKKEEYQCMSDDGKKRLQVLIFKKNDYINQLLETIKPYQ